MKKITKIILDSSPVISLALLDKLDLLTRLFDEIFIPSEVWKEVTECGFFQEVPGIKIFFKGRVKAVKSFNDLKLIMDKGESEAVLLYKELKADFLVIDDKRARSIAEESGVKCIGTLSILMKAREKGFEKELRPIFMKLLGNRRYFRKDHLNHILSLYNEEELD